MSSFHNFVKRNETFPNGVYKFSSMFNFKTSRLSQRVSRTGVTFFGSNLWIWARNGAKYNTFFCKLFDGMNGCCFANHANASQFKCIRFYSNSIFSLFYLLAWKN